jgi:hypothetical protein
MSAEERELTKPFSRLGRFLGPAAFNGRWAARRPNGTARLHGDACAVEAMELNMRGVWWITVLLAALALGCGLRAVREPHAEAEPAAPITRSFPTAGVKKVLLRAAEADKATVSIDPKATVIEVSGVPVGGAKGYHPSDPNWQETPAAEWGLDFVSAKHSATLVISTTQEIHYIHHTYFLQSLTLRVPPGVEVVREARELTGDGEPHLAVGG